MIKKTSNAKTWAHCKKHNVYYPNMKCCPCCQKEREEMSEEGEFKKRLEPYINLLEGEFGGGLTGKGVREELDTLLNEIHREILDNFSCLPKLQVMLLKWFGNENKEYQRGFPLSRRCIDGKTVPLYLIPPQEKDGSAEKK